MPCSALPTSTSSRPARIRCTERLGPSGIDASVLSPKPCARPDSLLDFFIWRSTQVRP